LLGIEAGGKKPACHLSEKDYLVALISGAATLEVVTLAAGVEENVNPDLTDSTV
jgi:hypothetical protein